MIEPTSVIYPELVRKHKEELDKDGALEKQVFDLKEDEEEGKEEKEDQRAKRKKKEKKEGKCAKLCKWRKKDKEATEDEDGKYE